MRLNCQRIATNVWDFFEVKFSPRCIEATILLIYSIKNLFNGSFHLSYRMLLTVKKRFSLQKLWTWNIWKLSFQRISTSCIISQPIKSSWSFFWIKYWTPKIKNWWKISATTLSIHLLNSLGLLLLSKQGDLLVYL
jgi:hypothetical protein